MKISKGKVTKKTPSAKKPAKKTRTAKKIIMAKVVEPALKKVGVKFFSTKKTIFAKQIISSNASLAAHSFFQTFFENNSIGLTKVGGKLILLSKVCPRFTPAEVNSGKPGISIRQTSSSLKWKWRTFNLYIAIPDKIEARRRFGIIKYPKFRNIIQADTGLWAKTQETSNRPELE